MKSATALSISLLVLSCAHTGLVAAAERQFDCTVTFAHAVADNGDVVTDTPHLKSLIGSHFTVERKSGEIRGGYFISNDSFGDIRVFNSPSTNTYYVVSISRGSHVSVSYLYIGNHRSSSTKPFSYSGNGDQVFSGFCR